MKIDFNKISSDYPEFLSFIDELIRTSKEFDSLELALHWREVKEYLRDNRDVFE